MGSNTGYLMVLLAALLWGTCGIFVNGLSGLGMSSATIAAFRLLCGALLLVPVLAVMGVKGRSGLPGAKGVLALFKVSPRQLILCVLMGTVGLAVSNCLYYESMREVGMATASVLLYTSPIFGCLLGRILYGEPVTRLKLTALAINVCGCVLTVTQGDFASFSFSPWGVASGVLAGLGGALLAVFSKMATERTHPLTVTLYGFIAGGTLMAALSFPWQDAVAVGSAAIPLVFGFGLLPTALAYILYMNGLSLGLEASKVPVIASFETIATVLVGIIVYSEAATPAKLVGVGAVLCSILLMNIDAERLSRSWLYERIHEGNHGDLRWWSEEKLASYRRLMTEADWEAWIAPR